jgi:hypothetical protein
MSGTQKQGQPAAPSRATLLLIPVLLRRPASEGLKEVTNAEGEEYRCTYQTEGRNQLERPDWKADIARQNKGHGQSERRRPAAWHAGRTLP